MKNNGRQKIRAGIIGGAGYTAGELVRLLVNHPYAELVFAGSSSNAGKRISEVHPGLEGECPLTFSDISSEESLQQAVSGTDVVFLCSGHGGSSALLGKYSFPPEVKIIDLSQDFRDESAGFVYGLPELQKDRISNASRVANPGCFATAIQLALLPLAANGLLYDDIHVTAVTGSTGAGYKPTTTTHFSWRDSNLSSYKVFSHQHLAEIRQTLGKLSGQEFRHEINFVPVRGDFTRGIFASVYTRCKADEQELDNIYRDYYMNAPFTVVSEKKDIDMKSSVNTNKALVSVRKCGDKAYIVCTIDNLLKGASGQAVQNMNLMFGLPEDCGLRLKASAF